MFSGTGLMERPCLARSRSVGAPPLSKAVRSNNFRKWVQNAMALAAQEHAPEKAANDQVARLEKDVQAQVAVVERIGNRVIEVGASDFLREKLRAEEAKLRDLRNALAKAGVPKNAVQVPEVTLDQVLAVLDHVEKVTEKSPARAREVLAGVIEPVTLNPTTNGYEVSLTLKNETAVLAGGRALLSDGCGGLQLPQSIPTAPACSWFLPTRRSTTCAAPRPASTRAPPKRPC